MNVRPRLTLSGRGLGAGVTIGPLRITRSGRGRWSLGLALPRARARRAADLVRARDPRPGAWPAPQGPRLAGPGAMDRCDCGRPLQPGHGDTWVCVPCGTIRDYTPTPAGPREGA